MVGFDVSAVPKPWEEPIRRLMAAKGWTQTRLSQESGIRKNTVNEAIHGGNPTMKTLQGLADAFGVPVYELFVSADQSAALRVGAHQDQLTHRQDTIRRFAQEIAPTLAAALEKITAPSPSPLTQGSQEPQKAPPADDHLARGHLRRKNKSA